MKVKIVKNLGIYSVGRKGAKVQRLIAKDRQGDSITMSIWTDLISEVHVGKIMKITNLRVENYPREKPHHITTTMITKILDLPEEEEEEFDKISLAEGSVVGKIECFQGVNVYDSCPNCNCKVKMMVGRTSRCDVCKNVVEEANPTFRFDVCLNQGNDNMFTLTGFKPSVANLVSIPSPMPMAENIEDLLNDTLEQKNVEIFYTINKKKMDHIVFEIVLKDQS